MKKYKTIKLSIDKVAEKLINEGIACWDDASRKNKLIVTGHLNY